jgi:hypothetical protein
MIKSEKEKRKPIEEHDRQELTEYAHLQIDSIEHNNMFGIFDMMPIFHNGDIKTMPEVKKPLQISFDCKIREANGKRKSSKINLTLYAAYRDNNQGEGCYLSMPTQRERIVLEALKKLAVSKGAIFSGRLGVAFTIRELQSELKRVGRSCDKKGISDALEMLSLVAVAVETPKGKVIDTVLSGYAVYNAAESKLRKSQGLDDRHFASFHYLIGEQIRESVYRQFNYDRYMSYKNPIAASLYKLMSLNFRQAGEKNGKALSYSPGLDYICKMAGISRKSHVSRDIKTVEAALKIMVAKEDLASFIIKKEKSKGKGGAIIGASFELFAGGKLIDEIILANTKEKDVVPTRSFLGMLPEREEKKVTSKSNNNENSGKISADEWSKFQAGGLGSGIK